MAATAGSKDGSLVDVVTAVAEAETTLQTVVAVRDKVIAAYQDIMKMPI
jgi:flagellar hook-basal body complex protein FliE